MGTKYKTGVISYRYILVYYSNTLHMGEKALSSLTYTDYLDLESGLDKKYEYHDGMITAMAGGSPEHGLIAANFITEVNLFFKGNNDDCFSYTSDVKIHIPSSNRTYYPDASVICGKPEKMEKDPNAIINPIIILEVLSESTVAFDRGAKFRHYRQLTSLREYILISQNEYAVDVYFRTKDGTWDIRSFTSLTEKVMLQSFNCEILMTDIYRSVDVLS